MSSVTKFDLILTYCYPHPSDSSFKNVFLHLTSTFICFLKSQTFHMSKFDAWKYEITIRECSEKLKSLFSNRVDTVKGIKVWTEQPCWTSKSNKSSVAHFALMKIYLNPHPSDSLCKLYLALYLFLFVLSSVFKVDKHFSLLLWSVHNT